MLKFRLTPDAKSDLIEIHRFTLKQWGEVQSKKYLSELLISIRLLAETPALGRSRPDIGSDVLIFPQASQVIYYVLHEKQLVVFGVLHNRMVPLNHLSECGVV